MRYEYVRADGKTVAWMRDPRKDKRFAWGDDYAGDAWVNVNTGEVHYVAVGQEYDPPLAQ